MIHHNQVETTHILLHPKATKLFFYIYTWVRASYIRNNDPQSAYAQHILRNQHEYGTITDTVTLLKPIHKTSLLIPYEQPFIQTYQYNGTLITEQNRGGQNPLFQLAIDTGLTSQIFHNKWIPTVRYTWISSNSTTRADGSRSGYVKTILLISIVLFPEYFIITKSGIHTVLNDFVYCIFR